MLLSYPTLFVLDVVIKPHSFRTQPTTSPIAHAFELKNSCLHMEFKSALFCFVFNNVEVTGNLHHRHSAVRTLSTRQSAPGPADPAIHLARRRDMTSSDRVQFPQH